MISKDLNLWLKKKVNSIEGRTTNYWIKIRRKSGYFDILIGKQGEDPHIHYGLNPDHTYKFLQHRGKVKGVKTEILKQDGNRELVDERIFSKLGEPQLVVKIRLNMKMKEGKIYTYIEGITLSEKRILSIK